MDLCYETLKEKPKAFRAFTGLDVEEFQVLLSSFGRAWHTYIRQHHTAPEERQRAYGGGRRPILATLEERLLFILVYFKTYPLQEVLAFHFDMSQGQAYQWIHTLSEVLRLALAELGQLPERAPQEVKARLEACMSSRRGKAQSETEAGEAEAEPKSKKEGFAIDATERRRQRPKDDTAQKKVYSGKKKAHTVKNNVLVTVGERRVEYLGQTWEGKKHDKKICDDEGHQFPEGSTLYKDTGY